MLSYEIRHLPVKRGFDILFSLLALVVCSPLFLCIACLIAFTSKGKIIYGHQRIGRGGKKFNCYKFRTMYPDADQRLQHLISENPELKKEWESSYKLKKDPRVTPIGNFLRKTSLDELPQFWNVLKGDLSVVGPRPVVESELIQHFKEMSGVILSVRPGITGLWQVSGRSDTSYWKRIELDVQYIQQIKRASKLSVRLMALDLKLIAKTIPCMIFSKGAY